MAKQIFNLDRPPVPRPEKKPKGKPITSNTTMPDGPWHVLYTDGSCWPNPGMMKIGYYIGLAVVLELDKFPKYTVEANEVARANGVPLGKGTNNLAEYWALIYGLCHAHRLHIRRLAVFTDSLLMVKQVNDEYKINSRPLKDACFKVCTLQGMFDKCVLNWIDREDNIADELAKSNVDIGNYWEKDKHTERDTAMMKLWWKHGLCRSGSLLSMIFGGSPENCAIIAKGHTWRHITEDDLS